MKKIIIAAFAACAVATASAVPAASVGAPLADSLAIVIGATQGAYFGHDTREKYSNEEDLATYRSEFMRGLREAVLADTACTGFSDGLNVGTQMLGEFKRMDGAGMTVNLPLFLETFQKYYTGQPVSDEEAKKLDAELQRLMQPMVDLYQKRQAEAQQAQREAFETTLNANFEAGRNYIDHLLATDKGYVKTASGLVYKVDKKGEGPLIQPSDKVTLYYTGRFVDGKEFDGTTPGTPAVFNASGLIKGFTEGLLLMNKGAKYTLVIPSDLGYGVQAPPAIGPGQTLIFEVEVIDFENKK